jgi:hypothetical protein
VDQLSPISAEQAAPRSLSAKYGFGAFPMHTDAAYLHVPPKYLALHYVSDKISKRPTLLWDLELIQLPKDLLFNLQREVWLVNGGRGRFLSSIRVEGSSTNESYWRFDLECMRPLSDVGAEVAREFEQHMSHVRPTEVHWQPDLLLILDNWRVIHGRANGDHPEPERVLERILIHKNQEAEGV